MMKINFLPRYGREAASSRIRVFAIAEELNRQGLADATVCETDAVSFDCDVLVIQKRSCPPMLPSLAIPSIVFDYDDLLPELLPNAAQCSRAITFDSKERMNRSLPIRWEPEGPLASSANQAIFRHLRDYPKFHVLPDCIDYAPVEPLPASDRFVGPVWFGNYGNFNCSDIAMAWGGPFGIVSDRPPANIAGAEFHQWDYDSLPRVLRNYGVAMLSHLDQDQGKSNNKLIAAVTLGVPCIVGHSLAYEELLRECDLSEFIMHHPADVRGALQDLGTQAGRQAYLDKIQPLVWQRYRAEVVARDAKRIYQQAWEGATK
jgi:hypothetical protein